MGIQTDRAYQELGRSEHFDLKTDAYIVGFEKRKKSDDLLGDYANRVPYDHLVKPLTGDQKNVTLRNGKFKLFTRANTKIMMPTQLVKHIDHREFLYNAYSVDPGGRYNYQRSNTELDLLFDDLSISLSDAVTAKKPYTHIFVMSMGWNNDQVESLRRYRIILENIRHEDKTGVFNPLVIGITWPSVWGSITSSIPIKKIAHGVSYPNKANDADEIGVTWVNWIVNVGLPRAIDKAKGEKLKVVLIGHSFGARLLGTALFSADFLVDTPYNNSVDLVIGIQGAFSARRFVAGEEVEGAPYSNVTNNDLENGNRTLVALITSIHDSANPLAHWITGASHVGGRPGLKYAKTKQNVFNVIAPNELNQLNTNKVHIIDVSEFVRGDKKAGISAHNDILNTRMGELLWGLLAQLEN